jgi:hypothetical protein
MDDHLLHTQLTEFQSLLHRITGIQEIESHIATQGPVSVVYKWRDPSSHERFLLSLEFAPRELKLAMLWLPQSLRNQGIGATIVEHLLKIIKKQHITTVSIEPRPGSEGFWEKLGFKPTKHSYWSCRIS